MGLTLLLQRLIVGSVADRERLLRDLRERVKELRLLPVEMDVDLLGAQPRIDQLDLLAAPRLHRTGRTFIQVQDFEHARLPQRGRGKHAPPSLPRQRTTCNIARP